MARAAREARGPRLTDRLPVPAPTGDALITEIEAVARLGWYSLDFATGRWVSSAGLDALFGIDASFDRSVDGWASLVHPDDRAETTDHFRSLVAAPGQAFDHRYRIIRADTGEERWVHGRGQVTVDGDGQPITMLGTISDITEQHRAEEALARSELRYATVLEGTHEAILIAERDTRRFRWANAAATAFLGYTRDELLTMTIHDIHPPDAQLLPAFETGSDVFAVPCLRRDGTVALADIRASMADIDGVPCVIGFFSDVTEARRLEARHQRLAAAVEYASDSILITDPSGTIEYVNPAFERASGYPSVSLIGQNPRIINSGHQSAGFYRTMWRRLTRGQTWTGTLVNRRSDGSLYEEEATISPIRDGGGTTTGYVGVKRDVTAMRAAETALVTEFRERAQVAAALSRLRPASSAEETAAEICGELLALPGVSVAAIFDLPEPGRGITLAASGPDRLPFGPGRPLPASRATYLYDRAMTGPWAEAWRVRREDGEYGRTIDGLGVRAVAYAPIRNGEALLGVVCAATSDEEFARHLIDHLPAVGEFAATASALLSHQLERGHRSDLVRARIRRVLADGAFHPVFQPIVALESGRTVGYEALTRFADGTPPDGMIAEAHAVGLGHDLELALLAAAIKGSAALTGEHWLSLNVSPDVILDAPELSRVLAGRSCRVVLEITEHLEIPDYEAVRGGVALLGPEITLAVDDAGSGFASLRHIVELRPQYLKVDMTLVRDVHHDLTRQAMIAGLARFAERADCQVIAEGIETESELGMLRELGVTLGQGYLLGRPAPVPAAIPATIPATAAREPGRREPRETPRSPGSGRQPRSPRAHGRPAVPEAGPTHPRAHR